MEKQIKFYFEVIKRIQNHKKLKVPWFIPLHLSKHRWKAPLSWVPSHFPMALYCLYQTNWFCKAETISLLHGFFSCLYQINHFLYKKKRKKEMTIIINSFFKMMTKKNVLFRFFKFLQHNYLNAFRK